MSSVSPSLVEAAARAMCANAGIPDTSGRWQQFAGGAETVLAAVGDALRLEGAQAEREGWLSLIEQASEKDCSYLTNYKIGYDSALDDLRTARLAALGGVHPEASDG